MVFWADSRCALIGALLGLCAFGPAAKAEITVSPLRRVIDEQHPVATFEVLNPSKRIIEGRVGWVDLAATERGYERATPSQRSVLSAAPYLAVSPASFRLEPGKRATITVALRKGARVPPGERRSHLLIESGAVRTPLRKAGGALEPDIGLGVSTPVVLRKGAGAARASIADTKLLRSEDGALELQTTVVSDGAFSAYGRIDLILTPKSGAAQTIGGIDNVSAWRDAAKRTVSIPLGVEKLPAGVLEIRFAGRAEFEGVMFAHRAFELAAPD
jgi:hypothetical protein